MKLIKRLIHNKVFDGMYRCVIMVCVFLIAMFIVNS